MWVWFGGRADDLNRQKECAISRIVGRINFGWGETRIMQPRKDQVRVHRLPARNLRQGHTRRSCLPADRALLLIRPEPLPLPLLPRHRVPHDVHYRSCTLSTTDPIVRAVTTDGYALRTNLDHRHNQSRLRRIAERDRRCQDDHRAARPAHASLRDRRNRQRKLALQEPGVTPGSSHTGPPPLRYMRATQRRASSAPEGVNIGVWRTLPGSIPDPLKPQLRVFAVARFRATSTAGVSAARLIFLHMAGRWS